MAFAIYVIVAFLTSTGLVLWFSISDPDRFDMDETILAVVLGSCWPAVLLFFVVVAICFIAVAPFLLLGAVVSGRFKKNYR